MSSVDSIRARVETLLAEGVSDRDELVAAVLPMIEMDFDAMRQSIARRRLSLVVSTIRNDEGERMAFPARDTEGRACVVHLDHSADREAMLGLAVRKRMQGHRALREADRLFERVNQLDLFERTKTGAA